MLGHFEALLSPDLVVHQHGANLTDQFVVALGQNLYFVGIVLTYLHLGRNLQIERDANPPRPLRSLI
jgi:hypothetical protein